MITEHKRTVFQKSKVLLSSGGMREVGKWSWKNREVGKDLR